MVRVKAPRNVLIDGDVLRYEVGHSGEVWDDELQSKRVLSPEYVCEMFDKKVNEIHQAACSGKNKPLIFLTADEHTIKCWNKVFGDVDPLELKPNFRLSVATTKPYKGTRKQEKPFHFKNLTAHIIANYDCRVASGIEADDLIVRLNDPVDHTIIASRDKDLRMAPGWHYSWGCGKQKPIGPIYTDEQGWLEFKEDGKVIGFGLSFFYYQMLVGDSVDNIPGVKGIGPKKAWDILGGKGLTKFTVYSPWPVLRKYREVYKGVWKEYIKEQATLLWIGWRGDDEEVCQSGAEAV